jgi:hypothetical protein
MSIEEPYYKDCMISDALSWVMISNANSEAPHVDEEDTAITNGDMNSKESSDSELAHLLD